MKASVIIPAFNAEKTIQPCLEALLNQDIKDTYEIIVVDDGSADRTGEIVRSLAQRQKQIRFFSQPHQGPAAARNFGARKAKGGFLLFTDADCIPERTWMQEMLKSMTQEMCGVQGRYKTLQRSLTPRFAQLEIEDRYDRLEKEKYIDFVGSYAACYRKDVFSRQGGFDEHFPHASGEDPALSFSLAEQGYKMVFAPLAVVYHTHVESLSAYLRQKFWRAYWRVLLYKKYPVKIRKDSYTPQSLKVQIGFFYLILLLLILSPLSPAFLPSAFSLFIGILLLSLPLTAKNIRKDPVVGVVTPLFVLLRTGAFSLGLLSGWAGLRSKSGVV